MEGAAPLHHYLLAWHTWHMAHIKPHLFEEGDMLVLCALHPTPIFKKSTTRPLTSTAGNLKNFN